MLNRQILRTISFFMIMVLIFHMANFLLWDDIHSLSRITMKEMYNHDGNIDTVMLGSSYVTHGFCPDDADSVWNKNSYNAGTKMQSPDASYYLLKEIIRHHDVDTVFFECNHVILSQFSEPDWGRNSIVSVYMKPSFNQFDFVYNTAGFDAVFKNSFPFLIRKKYKFTDILKAKLSDGYEDGNYKYVTSEDEAYLGDGFIAKYGKLKKIDNYEPICSINPDEPLTGFSLEYMNKLVQLCRENDIRLVLVTLPVASEMLSRVENAQRYIDALQEFASRNNIEYHNYNLVRSAYCDVDIDGYSDKEHLNESGARYFSKRFAFIEQSLTNNELSYDAVFYPSLKAKLLYDPDNSKASS